jgi:hypothetical protein
MPSIETHVDGRTICHPSAFTEVRDAQAPADDPSITLVVHRLGNIGIMDSSLYLEFAHEKFGDPDGSDSLADYADQVLAPHPVSGRYVEVVSAYDHKDGKVLLVMATRDGDRLYTWDLSSYGYGAL